MAELGTDIEYVAAQANNLAVVLHIRQTLLSICDTTLNYVYIITSWRYSLLYRPVLEVCPSFCMCAQSHEDPL